MHNCWIRTSNLVHTFSKRYHCTASANTSVMLYPLTGTINIRLSALLFPVTWRLVSDVGRGTRCAAARAGHDVAGPGPGLHLEVLVLAAAAQRASDWHCHGGTGTQAALKRLTEARLRNICRLLLAS